MFPCTVSSTFSCLGSAISTKPALADLYVSHPVRGPFWESQCLVVVEVRWLGSIYSFRLSFGTRRKCIREASTPNSRNRWLCVSTQSINKSSSAMVEVSGEIYEDGCEVMVGWTLGSGREKFVIELQSDEIVTSWGKRAKSRLTERVEN